MCRSGLLNWTQEYRDKLKRKEYSERGYRSNRNPGGGSSILREAHIAGVHHEVHVASSRLSALASVSSFHDCILQSPDAWHVSRLEDWEESWMSGMPK